MRLDVYWQLGKHRLPLGSIEVNQAFIELLREFERNTGVVIKLSGYTRLYPSQWKQLVATAYVTGYQHLDLKRIQAKFPKHTTAGVVCLEPD
jgi:hypothetical protein